MAKFTWTGMEELERQLSSLGKNSRGAVKAAVYAGAGIVADEIRKGIEGLKTEPDWRGLTAWQKKEAILITDAQREGLAAGLGIAKFQDDNGYINTRIGFEGYNNAKTRTWPNGQPNALIARACERGSTAMIRQPFVSKAVSRARKRAETEMARVVDEETKKIMD